MSSTLQIKLPHSEDTLSFSVISAQITESFDSLLSIQCQVYYEGLQETLSQILDSLQDYFYASLSLHSPLATKRISAQTQTFSCVGANLKFITQSSSKNSLNQKFFFSLNLHSALYLLNMNTSSRIFYQKSVVEVVHLILNAYAPLIQKEIDLSLLQSSYPVCEYLTQYKESDWKFVQRLCFNAGIFLLEKEGSIYLCDNDLGGEKQTVGFESVTQKHRYPFNTNPNNPLNEEFFYHFSFIHQLASQANLHSSFHPDSLTPLQTNSLSLNSKTFAFSALNHTTSFHTSSNFYEQTLSHLQALRAQMQSYCLEIQSNILDLKLGDEVQIQNLNSMPLPSNLKDQNEKYKIIQITHHFEDQANLASTSMDFKQTSSYSNTLVLLPLSIPFFPPMIEKPIVYGETLGIVIGDHPTTNLLDSIQQEKNTIHTDSQGRIKVVFAYSLAQAKLDQQRFKQYQSSDIQQSLHTCYLKVASPIASENSGFFALPRIGDEVLIGFLDGDCDKPIVRGGLYYHSSPLPYSMAEGYHYTSLSSATLGKNKSHQRNEITLKNIENQEEIYMFAQKDCNQLIQNDYSQTIKRHKSLNIQGTHTENIALAYIQNIGGLRDINIGAESMENVALSKDTQVGGSHTLNIGASHHLRVAGEVQENIGGNKEVMIQKSLEQTISEDLKQQVVGNLIYDIQGECQINAQKCLDLDSQSQMHFRAKENLDLQSESLSILNEASTNIQTQSLGILTQDESLLQSQKEIHLKVEEGMISLQSEKITLKAGGVEVTISKDGLVVKGGEIKGE